jgi:hypothetical protein
MARIDAQDTTSRRPAVLFLRKGNPMLQRISPAAAIVAGVIPACAVIAFCSFGASVQSSGTPAHVAAIDAHASAIDGPCTGEAAWLGRPEYAEYVAAYQTADRTGRPLLVLVGAKSCIPCRNLRQHTAALQARGALVELDIDRHGPLVKALRALGTIPRLMIWCRTGRRWQCTTLVGAEPIRRYAEPDAQVVTIKPD